MEINLKDKVSLITGSARGIGRAIAEKLAESGSKIIIADLLKDEAERTAKEIGDKFKVETFALSADVSKYSSAEECIKNGLERFGKIDILINNAGVTRDTLLLRMSPEDWDFVINVNLKGTFNFTKAILPSMVKQRSGKIVNIASVVGIIGNIGQANYSASKGGVIALTKTTAKEFAPRNINCNAIAPGFIDTEMTQKLPENIRAEWIKAIPMRRAGTPGDVANTALFLVSDLASYINGQVVVVDGGMVM